MKNYKRFNYEKDILKINFLIVFHFFICFKDATNVLLEPQTLSSTAEDVCKPQIYLFTYF